MPPAVVIRTTMRMSHRARTYLAILAARHVIIGGIALVCPWVLGRVVGEVGWLLPWLPPERALDLWGLLFLGTAAVGSGSAITRDAGAARLALAASVISTAAFAGTIIGALLTGAPAGWLLAPLLLVMCAKDLTMLRNPVRVPIEDVVGVDDVPTAGRGDGAR